MPTVESQPGGAFKTELRDIEKLVPHKRNAKKHSEKDIREKMELVKMFGQRRAFVVKGNVVMAGNGFLEAMKRLGYKRAVVTPTNLPDDLAVAFALSDNKTGENSEWNDDVVREDFKALTAAGVNVKTLGWSDAERRALLGDDGKTKPNDADEVIPEPPRVPVTKVGDVWTLGRHTLVCGDSFTDEALRLEFAHELDGIVTDPPYAIYGSSTGIGADIADDRMVRPFFERLFRICEQALKPFAHLYVCCDWRSYSALQESCRAARTGTDFGMWLKNCIVWDKVSSGLGNMYGNTHEWIAFFAKSPMPKAMKSSTAKRSGHRTVLQPNIFKHERARGDDRQHNAAKPPALFRWLMTNSTDKGDKVADFFGGSGTTLIAAEQTERTNVTFEIEPKYCDVVVERWQRLTNGKATRRST